MSAAAAPWSVKGIDPKAREIAKDLARRSGLTLGEWLNTMIMEDDEEAAVPLQRRPHLSQMVDRRGRSRRMDDAYSAMDDDVLQRLVASVDALSARLEASEQRAAVAITGIDQAVSGLVRRIDGTDDQGRAYGRRIDDIAEELKEGHRRLRRFEQDTGPKTSEQFGKVESSVQALTSRLYEIEERQRTALDAVRGRLEVMERGGGSGALAQAGARLDAAQSRTADALRALEQSFAGLDQRLRAAEGRVEPEGAREAVRFEKLAETLSRQVQANRDEMIRRLDTAAAEGRMERIERAMAALGDQAQAAERRSAQAVEAMGREVLRIAQNLDGRLRQTEVDGARNLESLAEGLNRKLEQDVARLSDTLDQRLNRVGDNHAAAIEKLGAEIGRISERLTDRIAQSERRSAQALEDIGDRLNKSSEKSDQRHERASGEFAERMRLSEERTAQLIADARARIDQRAVEAKAEPDWRTAAFPEDSFGPSPAAWRTDDPEPGYVDPAFPRADFQPAGFEPSSEAMFEPEPAAQEPMAVSAFGAVPSQEEPIAASAFGQTHTPTPAAPAFAGFGGADVQDVLEATSPEALAGDDDGFSGDTEFVRGRQTSVGRSASTRDAIEAARAAMASSEQVEPQGRSSFGLSALKRGGKSRLQERLDKESKREGGLVKKALLSSVVAVGLVGGAIYSYNRLIDDPSIVPGGQAGSPVTLAPALTSAPPVDAEAQGLFDQGSAALDAGETGALETITRSADMGYVPAQLMLANLNYEGDDQTRNLPEARAWAERAAKGGEPQAMFMLGMMNYQGEGGPANQSEAVAWLRQAAERGHVDAQFNLARIYEDGATGVASDLGEALKWYMIAGKLGDTEARTGATRLANEVSAGVRRSAEAAAAKFEAPTA